MRSSFVARRMRNQSSNVEMPVVPEVGCRQRNFDEHASVRPVCLDEPDAFGDAADVDHPRKAAVICKQPTRILVDGREFPLGLRLFVEVARKLCVAAAKIWNAQDARKAAVSRARRAESKGCSTLEAEFKHMFRFLVRRTYALALRGYPFFTKASKACAWSGCQRESAGRFSTMSPAAQRMRRSSSGLGASLSGHRM